jgi:hypothetical protein
MRSFGLNSPKFYEAVCEARQRPWIPSGALPRESSWSRGESPMRVNAENDEAAGGAVRDWLWHVEGGRFR